MANEARGETTLIENDGRQDIFAGCCQFSNDNWRRIGKYFYCFATMAALGLSMSAIVLANRYVSPNNKITGVVDFLLMISSAAKKIKNHKRRIDNLI